MKIAFVEHLRKTTDLFWMMILMLRVVLSYPFSFSNLVKENGLTIGVFEIISAFLSQ